MGSSHTGEGEKTATDSNVVRLPARDWLGPRDELVPFGAGEPEDPAAPAPTASDFWDEGSANVQTAWRGPDLEPAPAAAEAGPPPISADSPSTAGPRRAGVGWLTSGRVATLAAAAVGAAAIVVVSGIASSSAPPTHQQKLAVRADGAAHRRVGSTRHHLAREPVDARRVAHALARAESAFKQAVTAELRAHAKATHARQARAAARRHPALAQPVATTVSSTVQTPTTYVAPSSSDAGAVAASSARSTSGSSNAPAFGANGVLGPGSSPNG